MKQIADFFQDKNVASVLDVGTGSGDFLKVLKAIFPESKITGVDPNTDALQKAKEKYPEIIFLEMGAEKLDFPDHSFDVATISMALHHLPNVQASLKEMQRVVKTGGFIIVSELFSDHLNPAQEVHKLFHHFRSSTDRLLGVSHNETFKKNEIVEMIQHSGIELLFHFEWLKESNPILTEKDLEMRVHQMKEMLESVKAFPEYKTLKPQIEKFRRMAFKDGFESATRIVVVGKVK